MTFEKNNSKSKKNYYLILIVIEILAYTALFFTNLPRFLLFIILPFLTIEIVSNMRCLIRQKKLIKQIEFKETTLVCKHINKIQTSIDFNELVFSYREIKFKKEKSEIEINKKGKFSNKLIGRIHIKDWENILDIKNEFLKNGIVRIDFNPEGFWSKYGGLTAEFIYSLAD